MVAKSCNKSDAAKSSQQVQLALSYSSALWHQQCTQSSPSLFLFLSLPLSLALSLSHSLFLSVCVFLSFLRLGLVPHRLLVDVTAGSKERRFRLPGGRTQEHKGRVKWRGWSPVRDTRVEYSWADETAVRNRPVVDAESHCKLQEKENIKE